MQWLPQVNQLYFHGEVLYHLGMQLRATKRNLLKISARVYAPLGLISAITSRAKMLLKELCILGTSWDEELPTTVKPSWLAWLRGLQSLEPLHMIHTTWIDSRPTTHDPYGLMPARMHIPGQGISTRPDRQNLEPDS